MFAGFARFDRLAGFAGFAGFARLARLACFARGARFAHVVHFARFPVVRPVRPVRRVPLVRLALVVYPAPSVRPVHSPVSKFPGQSTVGGVFVLCPSRRGGWVAGGWGRGGSGAAGNRFGVGEALGGSVAWKAKPEAAQPGRVGRRGRIIKLFWSSQRIGEIWVSKCSRGTSTIPASGMTLPGRLELPTLRFTASRSNQLS